MNIFITILTKNYFEGFAALIQSIRENSGLRNNEYSFLIFADASQDLINWTNERPEIIRIRPTSDLPKIGVLSKQKRGEQMNHALQKLAVFSIKNEGDRLIYLDSDLICLGKITDLNEFNHFSAANDYFDPLPEPEDDHRWSTVNLNTGMMVFSPSKRYFKELRETYESAPEQFTALGDQDVINRWLSFRASEAKVNRVSSDWNLLKRMPRHLLRALREDSFGGIKFLHYVGYKPWWPNKNITNFEECRHSEVEKIWWDYFGRSNYPNRGGLPVLQRFNPIWKRYLLPIINPQWILSIAFEKARVSKRFLSNRALFKVIFRGAQNCLEYLLENNESLVFRIRRLPFRRLLLWNRGIIFDQGPYTGMCIPPHLAHLAPQFRLLDQQHSTTIHHLMERDPELLIVIGGAFSHHVAGFCKRLKKIKTIVASIASDPVEVFQGLFDQSEISSRTRVVSGISLYDFQAVKDNNGTLIASDTAFFKSFKNDPLPENFKKWDIVLHSSREKTYGASMEILFEALEDTHRIERSTQDNLTSGGKKSDSGIKNTTNISKLLSTETIKLPPRSTLMIAWSLERS